MEQKHNSNIEFLQIKTEYGYSISQLAKLMGCGVDSIKSYVCSPDTIRHSVVPPSKLLLLKLLVKGAKKKPLEAKASKGKNQPNEH